MSQRGESPERRSHRRSSEDHPSSAIDVDSTSVSSPALAKDLVVPASLAAALTASFQAAQQHATGQLDGEPRRATTSALGDPFKSVRGMFGAEAREKWNTKDLGKRLTADVGSAAAAGACVAPVITAIDRAIIENASNRATLGSSLRTSLTHLITSPTSYLTSRPFLLIFSLYTATYLSANTLDTASSTLHNTPAASTTSGTAKFAATSTTNLSLCLYKDSQFTRMFGVAASSGGGKVSGATYALFAVRDMLTIFASFNLPPMLADKMPLTEQMEKHVSRISAAQFVAPAAVQVLSTPLHLLGLDLYNRNGNVSVASRVGKVVKDWAPSCVFRICRIVPAFGVGGVVNRGMRERMLSRLE